jgi:hypothetical protein
MAKTVLIHAEARNRYPDTIKNEEVTIPSAVTNWIRGVNRFRSR